MRVPNIVPANASRIPAGTFCGGEPGSVHPLGAIRKVAWSATITPLFKRSMADGPFGLDLSISKLMHGSCAEIRKPIRNDALFTPSSGPHSRGSVNEAFAPRLKPERPIVPSKPN